MNLPCPICGKGEFSKKYLEVKDIVSCEVFSLLECDFCSVKKTHPVPEDINSYYENDMGRRMRKKTSNVHAFLKEILLHRELNRITRRIEVKEFLDMGCGTGDFSKLISEHAYKVSASDSAPERPQFLGNCDVGYYRIDYNTYEIENFKGMRDGLVILRHVIEHIKDTRSFITRLLDYGANAFYMVVPNTASIKNSMLREYHFHYDPPRHIWHFNLKSLKIFSEKMNLKVIDFGFDTIPTFIPAVYRYLRIHRAPRAVYNIFDPQGTIASLSLPFDFLFPNDVLWAIVRKK